MSISGIGEKYYQNNVTTMKSTNSKDKVQGNMRTVSTLKCPAFTAEANWHIFSGMLWEL